MRFRVFFFMLFFAWASPAAMAASPAAPEPVEISIGEATIHAMLFRPEGSGPFPAVVAMHGCSGL
jgi:poly(3-hydroxybutyrate) depolymerase